MLIYVVEDDTSILKLMAYSLKSKGYEVSCFQNGVSFFEEVKNRVPDLVLLDVMLPDIDGTTILTRLKGSARTKNTWVVMVTAKTAEFDVISALDEGADDYIKKPFSVMELLSRVGAIARRIEAQKGEQDILQTQDIVLNTQNRTVEVQEKSIELTYKEFELLKYLMLHHDVVVSRETLLAYVWGYDYVGETRTVDMHIKNLREKLEANLSDTAHKYIKTVRGVGYMFVRCP